MNNLPDWTQNLSWLNPNVWHKCDCSPDCEFIVRNCAHGKIKIRFCNPWECEIIAQTPRKTTIEKMPWPRVGEYVQNLADSEMGGWIS